MSFQIPIGIYTGKNINQHGNGLGEQDVPPKLTKQQAVVEEMTKKMKETEHAVAQSKTVYDIEKQKMEEERDSMKIMLTCLEISRRIMMGNNVPHKDHQYLLEHDPVLYGKAVTMRLPKSNPYDYKQLSEENKDNSIEMRVATLVDRHYAANENQIYTQVEQATTITFDLKI